MSIGVQRGVKRVDDLFNDFGGVYLYLLKILILVVDGEKCIIFGSRIEKIFECISSTSSKKSCARLGIGEVGALCNYYEATYEKLVQGS